MTPPGGLPKRMPAMNLYHVEIIKIDPRSSAMEITRADLYADDENEAMRGAMESADMLSEYYGRSDWHFKSIECDLVRFASPPKDERPEKDSRSWLCRLFGCR